MADNKENYNEILEVKGLKTFRIKMSPHILWHGKPLSTQIIYAA